MKTLVNVKTLVHMDTIQRASTAANGQINAGLQNPHTLHFENFAVAHGDFCFSFLLHAGKN